MYVLVNLLPDLKYTIKGNCEVVIPSFPCFLLGTVNIGSFGGDGDAMNQEGLGIILHRSRQNQNALANTFLCDRVNTNHTNLSEEKEFIFE